MFDAIVAGVLLEIRLRGTTGVAESTIATAMVSPRARPRPSITPETTPERAYGKTARRIVSQRVAPNAIAASSWRRGVWAKTSREIAVVIGMTMIASTMPAVSMVRPVTEGGPAKN